MSRIRLLIDTNLSQVQLENKMKEPSGRPQEGLQEIMNFMRGLKAGTESASMQVLLGNGTGTPASGTLTISANTAQSVTINGKLLTGGTDYVIAAQSVTQIAAAIAVVVNASTDSRLSALSATSALGVVTLTARAPGAIGNVQSLAATGAAAASGALLTGGVDAAIVTYSFGA